LLKLSLYTNTLSTLSIIGSHRTFSEVGGAYSTSLSSSAIGSALVDRLKLQSRVASRGEKRAKKNQDWTKVERERGVFGSSSLIDVDPIGSVLESMGMIRG